MFKGNTAEIEKNNVIMCNILFIISLVQQAKESKVGKAGVSIK